MCLGGNRQAKSIWGLDRAKITLGGVGVGGRWWGHWLGERCGPLPPDLACGKVVCFYRGRIMFVVTIADATLLGRPRGYPGASRGGPPEGTPG